MTQTTGRLTPAIANGGAGDRWSRHARAHGTGPRPRPVMAFTTERADLRADLSEVGEPGVTFLESRGDRFSLVSAADQRADLLLLSR